MKIKGTDKALIEEVKEEMSVEFALSEFIDSGFDYAKTRIDVVFNEEENYVKCMNDGVPMEGINDYVGNFQSHLKQEVSKKNLISTFGKGTKKAFLKLGDAKNGSTLGIYAKHNDKNITTQAALNMKIKKNNEECFDVKYLEISPNNSFIPYTQGTCMAIQNLEKDSWSTIHGIKEETGERRNDYYRIIRYCTEHYGLVSYKNKIDLYLNGNKIVFEDPCYIINLGEKINKDGCYLINGICYWVQTYKCNNAKTKSEVKFKVVYTFIPRMTYSNNMLTKLTSERAYEAYSGYYTYYGNRLMDNGGNFRKFFTKSPSKLTTGGCDRIRVAIFIDNNNEFFGLNSTKSQGIKPFKDNDNFTNFKINGIPLYTIMRQDIMSFAQLNDYDKKDSILKTITINDLKKVCKSYSVTKKKIKDTVHTNKEVDKIFVTTNVGNNELNDKFNDEDIMSAPNEDDLTKIIDNCSYITKRERILLYSVLWTSQLKKRATSEEFINNALKEIKDYGGHTNTSNEAA